MGARSTFPNCRKYGARLVARTTYDVVRCSSMVSNKEDKGLRYGRLVTITIKAPAPLRSGPMSILVRDMRAGVDVKATTLKAKKMVDKQRSHLLCPSLPKELLRVPQSVDR
ncbi:hypothetical protein B296_00040303 [Ensete ventricosum]|uniref:Uncharacterized protein n=1 Tax=Ensete ventricosum TaxID=4639 RepID=A0A426WZP6_ENSVE|nr:hypothetical protein B296_00040303 [Ensete ventricosum]